MSVGAKELPDKPASLEDLFAIPEDERHHELIDGELVEKGAATGEHGGAQADIVTALNSRFGRRPGGRLPGAPYFGGEGLQREAALVRRDPVRRRALSAAPAGREADPPVVRL